MTPQELYELIKAMITELVDHPDQATFVRSIQDKALTITTIVDPEQLGFVVGQQGRNANAIRTYANSVAKKNSIHFALHFEPRTD